MSKKVIVGSSLLLAVLFVSALIGDDIRRNVSDDTPLISPQRNPHPTELVKLFVLAPPSLKLALAAAYSVGTWSKDHVVGLYATEGAYCGPHSGAEVRDRLQVPTLILPVQLKWNGVAFGGEFYIDRYLPGACRWTFSGLETLSPVSMLVSGIEETDKDNAEANSGRGIYHRWVDQTLDLWCGPDPTPRSRLHGKMTCTSLDYFASYPGIVSKELLAAVPTERRGQIGPLTVMPNSKTLTLRFHDLAAEDRAAHLADGKTPSFKSSL